MSISVRLAMGLVLLALLAACERKELTNNDRRAVHAWLTCDDCGSGERAAVSTIGDAAVGELDKALKGPSDEQRSIIGQKLRASYQIADVRGRVPQLDSNAYTSFHAANYVATYQKRAATSLGDIGGDAARKALDAAIADSGSRKYRSDVIRVIKFSRSRLDARTYTGTIQPFRAPFGDLVTIVAPAGSHFGGQERVIIEDSLFPPTEVPAAIVGDGIKFLSIAPVGLHMVSVIRPNVTVDKIPMFVTSLYDATDRAMMSCSATDIPCMINQAPVIVLGHTPSPPVFPVVLTGTPADSLDFYRIPNSSAAPSAVKASLEWRGRDLVDLTWKNCATYTQVGQTEHGSANTHIVESTAQIPGNGCLTLQVSIAGGPGPAFGKLIMSPH